MIQVGTLIQARGSEYFSVKNSFMSGPNTKTRLELCASKFKKRTCGSKVTVKCNLVVKM